MSSLKLKHSGGNSVIIAGPSSNPAADRTINLNDNYAGDGSFVTANSSGNVGIGINAPAEKLDVDGNIKFGANSFGSILEDGANLVFKANTAGKNAHIMTHDGNEDINLDPSGFIQFETTGSERMRIDSAGKVGIGTTPSTILHTKATSGEPTFRIHCDTDSSPLASIELMRGANDTFGAGAYTDWKMSDASGGVFTIYQGENGSTTSRITINTSGVLSGDLNDTSDEKKKKNITSIPDGAIAKIKQLRPVNFNWKDPLNTANQSGFIAQEVKTVIPDLVVGEEYDETKDTMGYAINTSGVVAHLTKALQEAVAKIETLETKVAALEAG